MAKDNNKKPYINNGTQNTSHVGPDMVDAAPSILKTEPEMNADPNQQGMGAAANANGAFTQTPPPNYQVPPGYAQPGYAQPGYNQAPPYYSYNQKKSGGWWKGLLIFGIIVVVLVFLGYSINSFFSNIFSPLTSAYEEPYEIPDSDYIARIGVEGEITSVTEDSYLSSGTTYDHQFTLDSIDELIDDSNNKALLLFVDTPGGGVYESDQLYLKIKKYQEKTERPVYVAMGSMAASGGYYISASADKILADRNCWTGSIGVTMGTFYDVSEFLKKNGIKAQNLTSGKNKAMGSAVEPMTKEQKQIFQSLIDESYNQFVGIIADGRSMNIDDVKKIGDGRIYTAQQALSNGLIDGIATEDEATKMLQKDYDLKDCEVVSIQNYSETTWLDEFITANIKPLVENLGRITSGELGTAMELVDQNDKLPLKYIYEQ